MFYRFYVLADSGPCSSFHEPIFKSEIFGTDSLADVYRAFSDFLQDYLLFQASSLFLKPDLVYVVYGNDPKLCPYRSSNQRILLFGFNHNDKPYRTLLCHPKA